MKQNSRFIVVSDLHLTAGRDPERGTWSPTEDFFWDEEFAEFLAAHGSSPPWTLVVNGDMFDFMQVLDRPGPEERLRYGIPDRDVSSRFGLRCSEPAALYQIDRIAAGHPVALQAIAKWLGDGNRMVIIKGNHDVQLFWPSVGERLITRIEGHLPPRKANKVRRNLEIRPWCYYVPGLLYCEHGNQYDPATSFSHFLYPVLPAVGGPEAPQIELDLGSLIIRYVSNRLELLDPRTDNYRPLSDYLRLFFRDHPFAFLDTATDALRYIRKTAEKAWRMKRRGRGVEARTIAARNRELIAVEADSFAGGGRDARERLRESFAAIASRVAVPVLTRGVNRFLWEQARPGLRTLAWVLPLYLLTYVPDAAEALQPFFPGMEILFALRIPQALIAVGLIAAVLGLRKLVMRRTKRLSALDDPVEQLREEARRVEARLQVPVVTFGHSHTEDVQHLPGGGTYFNTGTWIGIYSDREHLYRGTLQFTYLRVEKGRGELRRWLPRGSVSRPAVVVDAGPYLREGAPRPIRSLRELFRRL